jgi:hypothetical protein
MLPNDYFFNSSVVYSSEEDSNLFFFNADDDLSKSISSMDQAPASGVVAAAERMLPAGDSFFTNFTMSLLGKFSQVPKTARRAIRCTPKPSLLLLLLSKLTALVVCSTD